MARMPEKHNPVTNNTPGDHIGEKDASWPGEKAAPPGDMPPGEKPPYDGVAMLSNH